MRLCRQESRRRSPKALLCKDRHHDDDPYTELNVFAVRYSAVYLTAVPYSTSGADTRNDSIKL